MVPQKKEALMGKMAIRGYVNQVFSPVADFNTEAYNPINENGFKNTSDHPLSTFSADVDAASYSNIR